MNVKIIRDTVAGGVPVFIGDFVDLPEQEAKYLIAIGKAEAAPASQVLQVEKSDSAVVIETADLKKPLETSVKKTKK